MAEAMRLREQEKKETQDPPVATGAQNGSPRKIGVVADDCYRG